MQFEPPTTATETAESVKKKKCSEKLCEVNPRGKMQHRKIRMGTAADVRNSEKKDLILKNALCEHLPKNIKMN